METRSIELTNLSTGHIICDLELNAQACRFIIDTGASQTILDEKFAQQLNLIMENSDELAYGAGKDNLQLSSVNHIEIMFKDKIIVLDQAMVLDISHINEVMQQMGYEDVQAVMGSDIMQQYMACIDYRNMTLKLTFSD